MRGPAFGVLAATQAFGNLAASGTAGVLWTVVCRDKPAGDYD